MGLTILPLAIVNFISGFLCMLVADEKNRSNFGWLMAGFITGILALIAIAGMPVKEPLKRIAYLPEDSGDFKLCPFCKEVVRREATKCRFCGSSMAALSKQ
jgi:hypothetical protein